MVPADTAVSGVAYRCTTIRVITGWVWITVEGEAEDYWLSAGSVLDVPNRHLVVCEAVKGTALLKLVLQHTRCSRHEHEPDIAPHT